MIIDGKFLTLLAFITINFLILFFVKTRTTTVISLIIAHLIVVLFLSLSISNYDSFKEVVLGLIIYSMVTLFLVSNYNPIHLGLVHLDGDGKNLRVRIFTILLSFSIVLVVFGLTFWITKNISVVGESVTAKKMENQRLEIKPSKPDHIAATKLLLSNKPQAEWIKQETRIAEVSGIRRERLQRRLADNFLLKRSSDVILIIVALGIFLMLLRKKGDQSKT